jgi:hypothetical protein
MDEPSPRPERVLREYGFTMETIALAIGEHDE